MPELLSIIAVVAVGWVILRSRQATPAQSRAAGEAMGSVAAAVAAATGSLGAIAPISGDQLNNYDSGGPNELDQLNLPSDAGTLAFLSQNDTVDYQQPTGNYYGDVYIEDPIAPARPQ